jgi:exonuclease III
MLIRSWNIRGLNSPLKQHEVGNLMRKNKLDVCGLLETKLVSSKVTLMQKFRLNKWKVLTNAAVASTARIVVLWNPATVHVDLIGHSAQGLHVLISSLVSQLRFYATFVYGFNTVLARRTLWDELRTWSPNSPWLILGDFNSLLSPADKHHGEAVSTYETADFRQCCSDLGLLDLNYSGCHYTWSNGRVWSKLDRVLVNPLWSIAHSSAHVHFDNPGAFSDHSPATVSFQSRHLMGRKCFKFFNMWSSHASFLELVADNWHYETSGSPMFILCKRLKNLKGPLRELNKLHYSHISERVARAEAALDDHQTIFSTDRDNDQLLAVDKLLRQELLYLKEAERQFFSQKLKCQFFKECDKGTSFFHALMSRKHGQNYIPAIHRNDGTLTTSIDEVGAVFVDYYSRLLGTPKDTLPLDVSVIQHGPCLDAASHASLLAPVSDLDIKNVLFAIDDAKAPGPDGYSSCFFKKSWDVLGGDFCLAVRDFFASGAMLKQINHSIIALIPKSANTSSASDFRPISCCNVIYKVIAKILALRLSHALATIISPMQNAFLSGRMMADNIHLLQELLRNYERKRSSPRCLMKIDFRKAFDSVQWPFLRQLLLLLGFPSRFVHLIMQCVETASYSVAVNGNIFGFFPGKNGVRQGDPLSPYLFLACMEYLSRMLHMASLSPGFRFHPKCNTLGICHLAFADDVILLSRGDRHSVSSLFQHLTTFGHTSGLVINANKSSIFFGGVADNIKQLILLDTGFAEGSFPFRYLGVPLSPHRLLASQFSPLLHKLESAIHGWLGKHLSYAGRVELLKSVLFGMVHFWLNIFPVPDSVIKQIICLCRNFLWTGNVSRSKSSLVAWRTVCLPKAEGGLGFFDIKARNSSCLAKQIWNIHLKADSIWIQWVHHYYLQSHSFWDTAASPSSSPLWKSILNLRDKLVGMVGGQTHTLSLMAHWSNSTGPFTAHAYEFLRFRSSPVRWRKVVWESWSMPRYNFILWLAVLGRLRTRDRLHFLQTDSSCVFCQVDEESHNHLFFGCNWTSTLWRLIKNWLHISRSMSSISSAIRGLHRGGNNADGRMRRASLGILVYIIWEERNKRIFEGSCSTIASLFRKFQILFYTVLHFHERDHSSLHIG